jgi:predicted lipid-binding transport protein (Tim44 family)
VKFMAYCPKCGNQVDETMTFCPKCGASLKVEFVTRPPPPHYAQPSQRNEKNEKNEKNEPEKGEKHEKGQFGFMGWLIGGLVLIVIGLVAYARTIGYLTRPIEGAVIMVVLGVAIIIVAVWLSTNAKRRNPAPRSSS